MRPLEFTPLLPQLCAGCLRETTYNKLKHSSPLMYVSSLYIAIGQSVQKLDCNLIDTKIYGQGQEHNFPLRWVKTRRL